MPLVSTVETIIRSADRLPNSTNGNPRWKVHTDAGTFVTYADAMCAYEVTNHIGHEVTLGLTARGTVRTITRAIIAKWWAHSDGCDCGPCVMHARGETFNAARMAAAIESAELS